MNIGAMPFVVSQSKPIAQNGPGKLASQSMHPEMPGKFGDVFSKIVASNEDSTMIVDVDNPANIEEIVQLLETNSLEDVLDLLNISHDEGLLMITIGDEGKVIPFDELLNSDELLSLLNLDLEQLNTIVQELLGEEVVIENIWDFIQLANEEPKFMAQITSILEGKEKGSPKEAAQLLQLLKITQLVGEQTDLKFNQPEQINGLKELLQSIAKTFTKEVTTTSGKVSIEGFQQVVEKTVETKVNINVNSKVEGKAETIVETKSVTKVDTTTTATNPNIQQSLSTPKTITVTLPNSNSTAQSEALARQIEAIISRSQMSNTQGTMKILLKLYPENLGSIRIELVQKDGMISARLLASTAIGKELLDSQIHQLKQAFVQQNIQLDRIDIQQSLQESSLRDQNLFNNMFKGEDNQDEEQESDEQQENEKLSFKDYLIDEEV
ncbi:MAG: flagellar hook-length control protein FliK [Lysinibacillus sp.]|nr:flagellar hook-length control protein FliK [Lysinibacillus sp.]